MKNLLILFMLVQLFTGCAATKPASVGQDTEAKAFKTVADKSNVYIYRNEILGAVWGTAITFDGVALGETGPKTYMLLETNPGRHKMTSHLENVSELEFDTEAGKNYFIWQEMKLGLLTFRTKLQVVPESVGRAGVMESKLIMTPALAKTSPANSPVAKPSSAAPVATATATATPVPAPASAPARVSAAAPAPVVAPVAMAQPAAAPHKAVKEAMMEFQPGISSVTVENLAKKIGCRSKEGASRVSDKGPVEYYRLNCDNGQVFQAKCELRQCKQM